MGRKTQGIIEARSPTGDTLNSVANGRYNTTVQTLVRERRFSRG